MTDTNSWLSQHPQRIAEVLCLSQWAFNVNPMGEKGNASLAVSQQADSNFYLKIFEVVPALSLAAVEGQILLIFIFIFF